jgi:hypothetical protein
MSWSFRSTRSARVAVAASRPAQRRSAGKVIRAAKVTPAVSGSRRSRRSSRRPRIPRCDQSRPGRPPRPSRAAGPYRRGPAGTSTAPTTHSSDGSSRTCLRRRGSGTHTGACSHPKAIAPAPERSDRRGCRIRLTGGRGRRGSVVVELAAAQQ